MPEMSARDRFLEMAKLWNSDAMKWEELRIKVALAAIGLVGAIVAFVLGNKGQSVLSATSLRVIAAVLIITIGVLSFSLVGRYTKSFHREHARAKAYRKAWFRGRDVAYAERKVMEAEKPTWRYFFNLWPLGQLVLVAIGIGLVFDLRS